MRKREELTDPRSCVNRARNDEWIFAILGRDRAAPATIRFWVAERIRLGLNAPGDEQTESMLRAALEIEVEQKTDRMRRAIEDQTVKGPDFK